MNFYDLNAKFVNYELNRMKWVFNWGVTTFYDDKIFRSLSKTLFLFFYCKR